MTGQFAQSSPATSESARTDSLYERVLFFVLLALVAVRPLIAESFERVELPFLAALGVGLGTTPAATAWMDALALTAAAAALARGWTGWRGRGWIAAAVTLLAVAVGISSLAADDKRLALNAGFNLLIGVLVGVALVQLMRAPWMSRLLLAALLASGCATACKCLLFRAYELDTTIEYWEEHKPALVSQGLDPDDPTVINFERRLRSGEANGYQAHPNVTGGLLVLWLLAAGGLLAAWLAMGRRIAPQERAAALVLSAAVCLVMGAGLWLTGSTGAMVATACGVLLLVLLGVLRRRIARHPAMVVSILAAAYVLVIAAATGYGLRRGTLPHPSLEFRWYYWTAGAQVFREAPLTGVGRLNFGDAYLRHKAAESTEEVRDPHNVWLTLLIELGPLGLLGAVVLIAGTLRAGLAGLVPAPPPPPSQQKITVGNLATAAIGVLLLHALFSSVVVDAATALLWSVEPAGIWTVSLVLAARLIDRIPDGERGLPWLLAGLCAALMAGLVHGLVDFALLTPGGLSVFVSLAAVTVALGRPRPVPAATRVAPGLALAGMALVAAQVVLVTVPTMRAGFWLRRMKAASFNAADVRACEAALAYGWQALSADPLDPGAAREVAAFAWALGSNVQLPAEDRLALLREAEALGGVALQRNPRSAAAHVRLARIYELIEEACLAMARADESVRALHSAADHWEHAVSLYPTDPRKRIAAGQAWLQWWRETREPQAGRRAAEHFAAALRIDARRKPEEVQRLRPVERALIEHHWRELTDAGFGPPASAPAP